LENRTLGTHFVHNIEHRATAQPQRVDRRLLYSFW
jgi:hypothetical protein